MDARLFRPECMGLTLRAGEERIQRELLPGGRKGRCRLAQPEPMLVLSSREAFTAEAVFERMFPANEDGPGSGDRRRHVPGPGSGGPSIASISCLSQWLALLDSVSQSGLVRFASAAEADQDELIGDLERGEILVGSCPTRNRSSSCCDRTCKRDCLAILPTAATVTSSAGAFWAIPGVWLENSAEENLSADPVTKGGRIQSLADVASELHRQQG